MSNVSSEHEQLAKDLLTLASQLHREAVQKAAEAEAQRNRVDGASCDVFNLMEFLNRASQTPTKFILAAIAEKQRSFEPGSYEHDLFEALVKLCTPAG